MYTGMYVSSGYLSEVQGQSSGRGSWPAVTIYYLVFTSRQLRTDPVES